MTQPTPILSIIIPIYNAQKYLGQCINSLLEQTYPHIEIICINDGSTDETPQLLQDFLNKDDRVRLMEQENAGPAAARNQGLAAATGEYLMFCDSDDWFEPQMCERMLATIQATKVDLVVCAARTHKEDEHYRRGDEVFHALGFFGYYEVSDLNRTRPNSVLWNKIFDRRIIEEHQINFPVGFVGEDSAFVFQYMSVIDKMYGLNEELYNRRLRVDSIMGEIYQNERRFDGLHTQKYNLNFLTHNMLWGKNRGHFIGSVFDVFINKMNEFNEEDQLRCLEITHDIVKLIDFSAFDSAKGVRGLQELSEIKERNFTRYIPKKKRGWLLTKEKYIDCTNTYFLGLNVFSKKQTKYMKEIRILGLRVYKKVNYAQQVLDELERIGAQIQNISGQ